MKRRFLCLIISFAILLSGCGIWREQINQSVRFHYLCKNYQTDLCCVIVSEEREASGHVGDLPYLLALYLMGPTDEEHAMPLPAGTKISVLEEDGQIILELSDTANVISDLDFSLACACLTMTVSEIADAAAVTIRCGNREKTLSSENFTLYDINSETIPAAEEIS